VNKDSVISAVFGILLGFIAGYLMHEVMASRQPQRFVAGAQGTMPGTQAMPAPGGAPGAPGADQAAAQAERQEIEQLEQYVQQNPNEIQAIERLAFLYYDTQQWPQAEALYGRLLELKPGDLAILSDLGIIYRELKQFDKALAAFQQVQQRDPSHWKSLYNEVVVLAFDKSELDQAQQALDRLIQMQPQNPEVAQLAAEVEKRRKAA
jgi:tetratricopeptide (TPR) repeat protein